jgi:acetyl esterase/lipase
MKRSILLLIIFLSACTGTQPVAQATETAAPATSTPGYALTKAVPYKEGLKMDIYAPSQPGSYPIVIGFHGGVATRNTFGALAKELAQNGIVTFVPDWHSTSSLADAFLRGWEDAACAVRWVRENAATYGGDPSRIIIVGHSAGGAVGASISLGGDDFRNHCLVEEDGTALADGFVGLDGTYHFLNHVPEVAKSNVADEIEVLIDPFYHVNAQPLRKDVRFILFVSYEEELRSYASDFHKALLSAGYSSELTLFDDIGHMPILLSPNEQIVSAIVALAYDQ